MKGIYLLNDAIISPLGFSTEENLQAIRAGSSGLKLHNNKWFSAGGFYGGIIENATLYKAFKKIGDAEKYTKLEQMMLLAVQGVLDENPAMDFSDTALIISTTKGNIDLPEKENEFPEKRLHLSEMGKIIQQFFKFKSSPIIVSNACISGGLALAVAKRLIEAGKYKQAIVVGGDLVSDFVVSGFQSFQAISDQPCRPFSATRDGISIGEAAAAILVSVNPPPREAISIKLTGEASFNDANHISGPSRTGEGLFKSINAALKESTLTAGDIDYISAHGTATLFNDEMEAIALSRSGLQAVPVNSFKARYGHTLGASALLESILTKYSLINNELFPSLNFDHLGTSEEINIIRTYAKKELYKALKTASGFGGCNLALVFEKEVKNE